MKQLSIGAAVLLLAQFMLVTVTWAAPTVHPDKRISFSLQAPEARSVAVEGGDGLGSGPFQMAKDATGVWSVTTPPAVPGFHYYWFVVDGLRVNDPSSETFFGYG
jgi:enterochelin esterase family protein